MRRRGIHHRKDSCKGKYRYRTLDDAQGDIERAKELRNETLRPYECEKCGSIHLSSWTEEKYREKGAHIG